MRQVNRREKMVWHVREKANQKYEDCAFRLTETISELIPRTCEVRYTEKSEVDMTRKSNKRWRATYPRFESLFIIWYSSPTRSCMARVEKESHFYLSLIRFVHKWNKPCLPLLISCRASSHFDRYSFGIPMRRGWVGLGGLPVRIQSLIPVLTRLNDGAEHGCEVFLQLWRLNGSENFITLSKYSMCSFMLSQWWELKL